MLHSTALQLLPVGHLLGESSGLYTHPLTTREVADCGHYAVTLVTATEMRFPRSEGVVPLSSQASVHDCQPNAHSYPQVLRGACG